MSSHLSDQAKGTLIMIAGVVVLSPDAMLLSLIEADRLTVVFWRGLLSAATLLTALVIRDGRRTLRTIRESGAPGVLSATLFAASTICFVYSISLTSVANTLVIVAASPLFSALLSGPLLGERVPGRTWLAAAAGLSAVAFIFGGGGRSGNLLGDFLALVTSISMAANFVIIRKYERISMIPAVAASGLVAALAVMPLAPALTVSTADFLLLVAIGSVVLPVPLAVMTVAPTLIPAAEVSLILLLETVLSPFLVWLAVGQEPPGRTVAGGLFLLIVLALHSWVGIRTHKRAPGAGGR